MIIQSSKIWGAGQFFPAQLEIEGSKIINVLPYNEKKVDKDYKDLRIVPGFIDIHTHGAYGFDTNYAEPEGLRNWLRNVPKEGITGFLPTTITQSEEVLTKALVNVSNIYNEDIKGAKILGVHFEGPYLDMKYKGAQPEQFIVKPSVEQFKRYQKASNNLIKVITLAPETDENFELTKYCVSQGIVVSAGHSASTYDQALLAVANGVKSMTHVYNGMTGFGHRENGLVGAAMRFNDVYGEIICDGNHSTLNALNIMFKAKGKNHAVMITDSLMCKGSPVGSRFDFGGNEIEIYPDGSGHIVGKTTLAGSTLKVNEGLKLLVEDALVPFELAINSCTINPATLIGLGHKKGKLYAGYDADIVVLNDDYSVAQTYVLGETTL